MCYEANDMLVHCVANMRSSINNCVSYTVTGTFSWNQEPLEEVWSNWVKITCGVVFRPP